MNYILVILTLFFSAFFSGLEIAFISSDKMKIEVERQKGELSAKIISKFLKKSNEYIATMLLGNNASLVIYGLIMAKILQPFIESVIHSEFGVLIIQTVLSTIIILVTAEFIPKAIFKKYSNKSLKIFAVPVWIIYIIMYPLIQMTIFLSNIILKRMTKNNVKESEATVFGKLDLNSYINKFSIDNKDIEDEIKIIQNALDFESIKIRECIVPRNEILAIDINSPISDLKKIFTDSGFSKIPVFEKSIDNILGYVHVHGMYQEPKNIRSIIVDIPIVPETMTAQKLFNILLKRNRSMAQVVDEYGGTSGIVTIEDILEEIFGEIEDEHDTEELTFEKISKNSYLFSGRVEIDRINQELDLGIESSEEYETITGMILEKLERFPDKNEEIEFEDFIIIIVEAAQPKINLVKLILKEQK